MCQISFVHVNCATDQHKPAMHVSTKEEHLIYQAQVAQKTVNLKAKFDIFLTSNMLINLWKHKPIR